MTLSQAAMAERQMEACLCGPADWVGRIWRPSTCVAVTPPKLPGGDD